MDVLPPVHSVRLWFQFLSPSGRRHRAERAAHFLVPELRIAQDAAADELLGRDPLALLLHVTG